MQLALLVCLISHSTCDNKLVKYKKNCKQNQIQESICERYKWEFLARILTGTNSNRNLQIVKIAILLLSIMKSHPAS